MKQIPNFPRYFATEDGRIWSEKYKKGKFLKPVGNHTRYLHVALRKNNKSHQCYIHHLVLKTFIGPCPPNMECCHNNGNSKDNNLENLRWDTKKENQKDSVRHSTNNCGEKQGNSKLTEQDVRIIVHMYKTKKFTQQEMANIYGVSRTNISAIINKRSWKHIQS